MRPQCPHLERLDRQLQVVDGGGRAGKVEDVVKIAFHVDEVGHVQIHKREALMAHQVGDVVGRPRDEVVHADHMMAFGQKALAEMRAEEAGTAGDERAGSYRRHGRVG